MCEKEKEYSEFGKDKQRKDGMSCYCKLCKQKKSKSYADNKKINISEKECKKCNQIYPVDNFHNKADTIDGKQSYCKDCTKDCKQVSREIHKGEEHKCSKCEYICTLKDSLTRHIKTTHPYTNN